MTRFVIIGGSGFVGQWLVKRWVAEGRTMLVDDIAAFPDNNVGGFDYVDVDIRDEGECLDFCVQGGFQGGSQSRLSFVYKGVKNH